jgi:hypothetical protein
MAGSEVRRFGLSVGLRLGEVLALQVREVDLAAA